MRRLQYTLIEIIEYYTPYLKELNEDFMKVQPA